MDKDCVMTTIQIVLQLLKACLFTDESVNIADWNAVFEEMKLQSVAALPGEWMRRHPVSGASKWSSYCTMQQGQWVRVMHAQEQLSKLLDDNGIPFVILKGAAAAMAYPVPSLRSMGDVDLLVKRSDFNRTEVLMEENGYVLFKEKNLKHHHDAYRKDGIIFELHRRLGIVDEANEELLAHFEKGIENREEHTTDGYRFPALPVALNGVSLLYHIDQHIRSGLGLRQIIDWMMFVNKLPENIWQDEVLPLLCKTGTEKLALTVTAMCQKYLGLRKIVEETDDLPCNELMSLVLENGNFGMKSGVKGHISSFSLLSTNVGTLFRRLQTGGKSQWKATKKYRILRPFAWIYQVFRILGIFLKNRIGLKKFIRQRREGLNQRDLIRELGLNIDRTIRK